MGFFAVILAAILAGSMTAVDYPDDFSSMAEERVVDHASMKMYCPYAEDLLISFFQVALLAVAEGGLYFCDHPPHRRQIHR